MVYVEDSKTPWLIAIVCDSIFLMIRGMDKS